MWTSGPPRELLQTGLGSMGQAVERAIRAIAEGLRKTLRARLLAALLTMAETATTRTRSSRGPIGARAESDTPSLSRHAHIVARRPNPYWMGDLTVFPQMGKADLYLAALIDVYSRRTLAHRIFASQPTSEERAALLDEAVAKHGRPRYFVSDKGGQSTGEAFERALDEIGCDHRVGALGQKGSIAIIERLWKTVKEALEIQHCPPLIPGLLEERVGVVLDWHDRLRPHRSLRSATPAEIFAATPRLDPKPAPRGRLGQATEPLGLVIRFALQGERRRPSLERVA